MDKNELNDIIKDSIDNGISEPSTCKKCGKNFSEEKKPCKKCQKLSGEENKKCTKCEENKKKVAPYLIASFSFLALAIYGFVNLISYLIDLFSK
jgi:hypothetical protein